MGKIKGIISNLALSIWPLFFFLAKFGHQPFKKETNLTNLLKKS